MFPLPAKAGSLHALRFMKFALVYDSEKEQGPWIPQRVNLLSEIGEVETVTSEDIMGGRLLQNFDAVTFPGGIASFYGLRKWGNDFALAIRFFVAAGGGFLGICGGAYVALKQPASIFGIYCNRTLALADTEGAAPGASILLAYVSLLGEPFPEFVDILNVDHPIISGHQGELIEIPYSGGPGFFNFGETVLPLAQFHEPEWEGKTAVIASTFGQGRVVLCGPHPENPWESHIGKPSVPWLYPRMATWVAEREIKVDYPFPPWAKPRVLPSGLPLILGAGLLTVGIVSGKKIKGKQ